MRFTVRDLMERGVDRSRIKVTLERNMQCGIGLCGHCQLGPYLLCRDGPIFDYAASLEQLLLQRQR
jgi:NAD(P)H-flavin reductase